MSILQVPFDISKDWKQKEEAGYWDTEHCISEDWKQEEETGYGDTTDTTEYDTTDTDICKDWKEDEGRAGGIGANLAECRNGGPTNTQCTVRPGCLLASLAGLTTSNKIRNVPIIS